ncbi:uncharacterized protein LOC134695087 [Mytilus trossulus]|uniref:uncharacterized protein LOC134695087 n=1 Tax=Mytilus trossulus TaxID=6551 RepID=UPI0030075707
MNRIPPPGNYQNRKYPAAYQSVDNRRHRSISDLRAVNTPIPPEDYPLEKEHESFYNKGYRQIKSSHVARTTDKKTYSTKTRRAPEPPLKPLGRTKPQNHYTNVSSRYEGEKFEPNEDYPIEEIRDYDVVSKTINYTSNLENVGKETSHNVKVPSSKTTRAPMPLLHNLKRSDSTLSFGAKSVSINPMRSKGKQYE